MDSNLDDSGLKDMIGQIPRVNESGSVGVSIEHKDEYVQRRIYSVVGTNEGDESKTDMDKVEHHFDSSPKDKNWIFKENEYTVTYIIYSFLY